MTSKMDRRAVLRGMAGAGATAALPDSIRQALAIPAKTVTGTIQDVKHIVVLMQENRSFDHYFGTLRGVRGFGDPRAVKQYGSGKSIFEQPNLNSAGTVQTPATILPFHPAAANLGQQFLTGLPHAWADAHKAWNDGHNDRWVPAKGKVTMAYMQRSDIPFYYALADAFTICDAYHCSIMASTDPNRYYLWTGWCGQNGTLPGGISVTDTGSTPGVMSLNASGTNAGNGTPPYGPVVSNAEQGYGWTTYPERLEAAGISWKIYQDIGHGLNSTGSWGWDSANPYIGNYGDNSLLYFNQYRNAQPGSALYEKARTGTNILNGGAFNNGSLFDQLRADVLNGTLPQVSWIAAPEAYSEHSNWPTSYGTWYIQNVLNALTANPEVWASTVFIICFDENDGFFDHIVAPTPPATAAQGKSTVSTVNELYPGASSTYVAGPYGLGARVPMLVISPWSKGGWVNSETFDHTSILRFIEKRFGIGEPNISPWRRTVCGDLTSTLDFSTPNASAARLPSTAAYAPPQADVVSGKKYSTYTPAVPANQQMPLQEPGTRLARALPYELQADWTPNADGSSFGLNFVNTGTAGAWLHVRTANGCTAGGGTGPWGYTVEAGKVLADTWTAPTGSAYDVSVHGPNGFFRRYAGSLEAGAARLVVRSRYDRATGGLSLTVTNAGSSATTVTVTDRYTSSSSHQTLQPGASFRSDWSLQTSSRWYDLAIAADTDTRFIAHFAGHVETGAAGISDPLL
ncbi:MAG: phospholipase C, phosphocholine-specific [Roseateles depolymerans]|uniref:phospholipase C n=1 Tax=Roseateles depolymerans TaxID=76731 RepID=A0A2W5DP62_9BURK|nr:MAG: phospholipase C, phosphocholine-specific [Roseateles depolymerans]